MPIHTLTKLMNVDISNIQDRNKPIHWCFRFVDELFATGVRHVIISPGSRSTPLALAFDVHAGFSKQVVLDERSAAYIGLGIGKATGYPAALVCTSGTAAANYFPAVIEARQSETPLLVLTADRPPNQRYTGASQTIDQIKLYGDYPLFFHDTGEPAFMEEDLNRLRLLACQASDTCRTPGGPVHLNFPFRKPLEPASDFLEELKKLSKIQVLKRKSGYVQSIRPNAETYLPEKVLIHINKAKRPVVIAGTRQSYQPGGNKIIEFAERLHAPLLAESSSQAIGSSNILIKGFDSFLRSQSTRKALKPDLIIRTGNEPVSKGLNDLLCDCRDSLHISLFESELPQNATLSSGLRARVDWSSLDISALKYRDTNYLKQWQRHSALFQERMIGELNAQSTLSDPHVYHDLVPLIPYGFNIVISNSFPVRDFDTFGNLKEGDHSIIVNRGAAGIDGVTSTAIGCYAGRMQGTILFTGDMAFLHDANALQLPENHLSNSRLIVIVVNNNSGSIFRMLPFEKYDNQYVRLFETPQSVSFEGLISAHGWNFISASDRNAMTEGFRSLLSSGKASVLECVTDAGASMQIRKNLWK